MRKYKMKKAILICLLFITAVISSGCWDMKELEQRAIVSGIALDKNKEGLLEVSCQVVNPGNIKAVSTRESGVGGSSPVTIYSVTEGSVSEAVEEMAAKTGRELFLGHNRVLIIGENAARDGLEDVLDFFNREPKIRRRLWLAVTPGKAREVLEAAGGMGKVPAYGVSDIINASSVNSKAASVRLQEFFSQISKASVQPVASRVEIYEGEKGQKSVKASGAAVFKRYKLVGYLDQYETRGYLWIISKVKGGVVSAFLDPEENKRISMKKLESRGKIEPRIHDDVIEMTIKLNVNGDLGETTDKELDLDNPQTIKEMEQKISQAIASEVESSINKAKELDCDIFGFGEKVRRSYPREWKKLYPDWEENFKNVDVKIAVSTTLRRTGKISDPARSVVSFIVPSK